MSDEAPEVHSTPEPTPAPAGWAGWSVVAARLALVAALVALDLWSKTAVFAWLAERPAGMEPDLHGHWRYPLLGDWLTFYLSRNPGMAWGITALSPGVLVAGRVAAVAFLLWLLARMPRGRGLMSAALVLILAGALGNLNDNVFLRTEGAWGEVRDFIDVYFAFRDWHFPTFNVADSCITVGAVFLFLSSFFGGGGEHGE